MDSLEQLAQKTVRDWLLLENHPFRISRDAALLDDNTRTHAQARLEKSVLRAFRQVRSQARAAALREAAEYVEWLRGPCCTVEFDYSEKSPLGPLEMQVAGTIETWLRAKAAEEEGK